MKINIEFNEDETETAQRMLDWHVYYAACVNVLEYCREHMKHDKETDMRMLDIMAMVHFVDNDNYELE